ncbi:MAG: prepilin-type N-terminal cleavage/methylation domain-containing protein [Bradyrhizobium sp.]
MTARARQQTNESGFTLVETLVALALMGLVLSALANLTAQWLPNWNRGLDRIQRSEQIGIALQRIADDLAVAESVPVSRAEKQPPFFSGSERSVTFVRTALGPNAGLGLDVVHLGETTDQGGLATVRSRTLFRPLPPELSPADQFHFGEPVVLLRAPYRLTFAYAGDDHAWKSSWRDAERLPSKIRLTVSDASSGRVLTISTVASIHIQSSAQGDCKPQASGQQPSGQQPSGPQASGPQASGQQASAQQPSAQQPGGGCDDNRGAPANAQGGSQQAGGTGQGVSQ